VRHAATWSPTSSRSSTRFSGVPPSTAILGDEQQEIADMAKILRKQLDKLAS
jgi:hypothetical protein